MLSAALPDLSQRNQSLNPVRISEPLLSVTEWMSDRLGWIGSSSPPGVLSV